MIRELHSCVVYGRSRCDLPKAVKTVESGPSRCHSGRGGTVFGVGTVLPSTIGLLLLLGGAVLDL